MTGHPYLEKKVVLTSKHEKLKLIKPAFDALVGCELFEENLDTDQLGTFSGEIERVASPRETALQKAQLGMKETGLLLGLASEGSIGPDPVIPFMNSNIEHLVFVDDENGIVISEIYRSFDITAATITAAPGQDLASFLETADFPRHALIVRPNTRVKSDCIKGITDPDHLIAAIEVSSKISPNGFVVIESDLRAMHSPSRRKNIEEVAKLLALRVSHLCPECDTPGWGQVDYKKGLNCSECGMNNLTAISQEILGCVKCDHRQPGKVIAESLEPAQCNFCNP